MPEDNSESTERSHAGKGDGDRSLKTQDYRDNHDRVFAPKPNKCSCGGKAIVKPHTVRSMAYGVQCTRKRPKKCGKYNGYYKTWSEAVTAWNKIYP